MSIAFSQQQLFISDLIAAALHAVDPAQAVRAHLRRDGNWLYVDQAAYDLAQFDEVVLIAVGKAAVPMAIATRGFVEDMPLRGVVVTKYAHVPADVTPATLAPLILVESAHPVPDANSLHAGELVSNAIVNCSARSLVLACISGGASALMIAPYPGIQLATMQAINDALLRCGADIREMNTVRSRLDRLKGGNLARLASPGTVIGLILSDVIGDPLDIIASGLTYDPCAHNTLIANNTQACAAVARQAHNLGFATRVVTTEMRGEARQRAVEIAAAICAEQGRACLIYGGETTVTLAGNGQGGRNQELALAAAIELDRLGAQRTTIVSFGTDGTDGPTDAAGAVARDDTIAHASSLGLNPADYLARNDSYHFFQAIGDLIITGPTGTNVADVVIALRDI